MWAFLLIQRVNLALILSQVNDLLSLKQQQASVVQAYEAMKQGEETVRQGKAIMVFTVVTIIFVSHLLIPIFIAPINPGHP